jgi:serine/threonine protein kinase
MMADLLKTTLGNRYTIHERIGAGGMARVFKAKDTNLDRWVAVKILHEHLSDDPNFSERFTREAKLVASLNHPNIVQVYDYSSFERDGVPIYYMVMPLLPGDSLRTVLDYCTRQGIRLPQRQTIAIMQQIANALAYAHERGMAHRDIKPGNIIMDETGRPILTDFGIARMVEATRFTQDSMTTGTPAYMSPEQGNGQAGDARSDQYSLAVMFFEMWTGKLPYADESPAALIFKHLHAPIPTVSGVTGTADNAVDDIMRIALAKDPAERYSSVVAFAEALQTLTVDTADDQPLSTSPRIENQARQPTPVLNRTPAKTFAATLTPSSTSTSGDTTRFLRKRFSAAFVIFAVIFTTIAVLLVVMSRNQNSLTSAPANTLAASIPAIDPVSNTNQEGFTANFNPDDPDRLKFPVNPEERGVSRTLLEDTGTYRVTNTNFPSASTTIIESDLPYGNITITMVAQLTLDSAQDAGYGIIFRYQDEDNYNVFAVDGLGRYSIWVRQVGQWRELERQDQAERWQPNEHVLPIGEENRLRINVTQEALTLFINNQPITDPILDTTFITGSIGIYVAAPNDGIADVMVDLFEVYPIIPSMTEPGRMG